MIDDKSSADDTKTGDINKSNDDKGDGSDPKKTSAKASPFDVAKIGDEDFNKVFDDPRVWNHPRFKQLNERAKRAAELEKQQEETEKKKLKDQEKFKELAEKLETEKNEVSTKYKNTLVDMSIQAAASKLGAVDAEAVAKLIDRANITIDDNGVVSGVDEAVKALQGTKSYLFGEAPPIKLGSGTNPGQSNATGRRFKLTQIQDTEFFRENEAEIMAAYKQGLIENDLVQ
jgi:ribosomal protein L9